MAKTIELLETATEVMEKAKNDGLEPLSLCDSAYYANNPDDMVVCEHCHIMYNRKFQWSHQMSPLCLTVQHSKAMGVDPFKCSSDNQPNLSGC